MPELPEVETVRRGLDELLPDREISQVEHDWPKSFPNAVADVDQFLIGARVRVVRRRAKVLIIDLSTKYSLVVHLKMTGQMVFVATPAQASKKDDSNRTSNLESRDSDTRFGAGHPNDSLIGRLPDKSSRVQLTFTDGSRLFFNDQRKFGWMKLLPTDEVMQLPFFLKVGPEPLEPEFTAQVFMDRVRRRANTNIKAALLDQTVLAGVGNIYADESLWAAKIHPTTTVKTLSDDQLKLLHKELIAVMRLAIEKGGSTDRNYVDAKGKKGSYMDFAKVFRLEGTPCSRCSTEITKTRVAGRGTHTCESCQLKGEL